MKEYCHNSQIRIMKIIVDQFYHESVWRLFVCKLKRFCDSSEEGKLRDRSDRNWILKSPALYRADICCNICDRLVELRSGSEKLCSFLIEQERQGLFWKVRKFFKVENFFEFFWKWRGFRQWFTRTSRGYERYLSSLLREGQDAFRDIRIQSSGWAF